MEYCTVHINTLFTYFYFAATYFSYKQWMLTVFYGIIRIKQYLRVVPYFIRFFVVSFASLDIAKQSQWQHQKYQMTSNTIINNCRFRCDAPQSHK